MCNNGCYGNNLYWIIILLILFGGFGNTGLLNNGCGCGYETANNGCGCGCGCN